MQPVPTPPTPPVPTPAPAARCVKCGYDLSGAASPGAGGVPSAPPRCPECGTVAVPRCAECGYDLSGIGSAAASVLGQPNSHPARCPECGAAFDPSTIRILPDLPGFWRLAWICTRPACAYLAVVLFVGMIIARRPIALWGGALACLGPPLLLGVTLGTVVNFAGAHYIEKDRWWVVFLMILASLTASTLVAVACSLGLGAI